MGSTGLKSQLFGGMQFPDSLIQRWVKLKKLKKFKGSETIQQSENPRRRNHIAISLKNVLVWFETLTHSGICKACPRHRLSEHCDGIRFEWNRRKNESCSSLLVQPIPLIQGAQEKIKETRWVANENVVCKRKINEMASGWCGRQCGDENTLFLFKCYLKSISMRLIITHMLSPCPPVSRCLFLFQASIKQFLSFGQWAYFNDHYFVI